MSTANFPVVQPRVLLDHHQTELRQSGLTDETITAAGDERVLSC